VDRKEVESMKLEVWKDFGALERPLEDVFRPFFALPAAPFLTQTVFVPVDVFMRDSALIVHAEIPGIEPDKVKVTVEGDMLFIRGERIRSEKVEELDYVRMERTYGSFERVVRIPKGVEESAIRAEYRDGVLEVTVPLPKAPEALEPKAIPIYMAGKT
jgi:HSP20 family protein